MLAIAVRDHHGQAHALRDPATGAVAAFDVDLTWGLVRYLRAKGADVHGVFAAPAGCRIVVGLRFTHRRC